jgi:enoyl-CoA hydratase
MPASPTAQLLSRMEGSTGWITYSNPERLNAITLDMWEAIPALVSRLDADPEIRVIAFRGSGDKAFVSGADISQFEDAHSGKEELARYDQATVRAFDAIATSQKPTIAMIQGFCIGGGLGLALACDLRIAAQGSQFGIPAAKLGLAYPIIVTKLLVDIVGPSRAKDILLTGRRFDGAEALGIGLVNQVVPALDILKTTETYIGMISENAPLTVSAEKKIVDEIAKAPENFDAEYCERLIARCYASEDYAEGRKAFMEKRKARFAGR